MFSLVTGLVVLPHVADVFQEQQSKHIILVDGGIDDAPKGVTSAPCGSVDFGLGDWLGSC